MTGPTWAYSYCHATQLRRKPSTLQGPYVQLGSCLIFCSGDRADKDEELVVDTVFWVDAAHEWRTATTPPARYAEDIEARSNLWRFHLRFGGVPGGHDGLYTYEAALHPRADERFSHLPLDQSGERVSVPLSDLSDELQRLIRGKLSMKRPVPLSDSGLEEILEAVRTDTTVAVVGSIRPDSAEFGLLRQKTGADCGPGKIEAAKRRGPVC